MTSDTTGEIRCPSCGRFTPLAPFCTYCGGVIPEGASGPRPHAMDRQELEERARQLRGSGSPFRRGLAAGEDESGAGAWSGPRSPGPFVPEPSDELARRAEAGQADQPPRVDHFDERTGARLSPTGNLRGTGTPPAPAPRSEPAPVGVPLVGVPLAGVPLAGAQPSAAGRLPPPPPPDPYGGLTPDEHGSGGGYGVGGEFADPGWSNGGPPRRSSSLPVIGFLVLGVAALLGGALLFAALNAPAGVADQTASPTSSEAASAGASETAIASPTDGASGPAGGSAQPSAPASPDNFTARAQPCASNDMGFNGCSKDGTTLTGSQVWVWVGFKNGQAANVLGVTIVDKADGSEVGDGSLELDKLTGCDPGKTCSGYIQMTFGDLSPGAYTIQVSRDGAQVATTDFSVAA